MKGLYNTQNISFDTFYSGQFKLSIWFIIPNYFVILSHSFFRNLPPLSTCTQNCYLLFIVMLSSCGQWLLTENNFPNMKLAFTRSQLVKLKWKTNFPKMSSLSFFSDASTRNFFLNTIKNFLSAKEILLTLWPWVTVK